MAFSTLTMVCSHHFYLVVPKHFHHPKGRFHPPISSHSPLPPPCSPWQPVTHLLSPGICLFWASHRNGITYCVSFCVWLLSLSIMFPRFTHTAVCVSASFLSEAE